MHQKIFPMINNWIDGRNPNKDTEYKINEAIVFLSRVSGILIKDLQQDSLLTFLQDNFQEYIDKSLWANNIALWEMEKILRNSKSEEEVWPNIRRSFFETKSMFQELFKFSQKNSNSSIENYAIKPKIIPFIEYVKGYVEFSTFGLTPKLFNIDGLFKLLGEGMDFYSSIDSSPKTSFLTEILPHLSVELLLKMS